MPRIVKILCTIHAQLRDRTQKRSGIRMCGIERYLYGAILHNTTHVHNRNIIWFSATKPILCVMRTMDFPYSTQTFHQIYYLSLMASSAVVVHQHDRLRVANHCNCYHYTLLHTTRELVGTGQNGAPDQEYPVSQTSPQLWVELPFAHFEMFYQICRNLCANGIQGLGKTSDPENHADFCTRIARSSLP